jgi:hypothetical protein
MVSPDGIIQTVLGGGSTYNEGGHPLQIQASPVSMWFDAQGRMYFTETTSTIRRINSVYKPSWWDAVQYEKICKPCNAIVRPPPLPPVPTVLRLVNPDGGADYDNTSVVPSNSFIHVYFTQPLHPDDYGAGMKYVHLLNPNLDGVNVLLRSATLNSSETELVIFQDSYGPGYTTIDTGYTAGTNPGIENANTLLVLNFESQINFIDRVFYSDAR